MRLGAIMHQNRSHMKSLTPNCNEQSEFYQFCESSKMVFAICITVFGMLICCDGYATGL